MGEAVHPNHGIPAGCPLANGLLHVYLKPAMEGSQTALESEHQWDRTGLQSQAADSWDWLEPIPEDQVL
eukprot:1338881-Heterocapsa_arctica.AAC.1